MSITLILVVIIIGVSLLGFQNQEIKMNFLHWPYRENHNNEYYRLISHAFLHADITHLLFNMVAMYTFGRNVELFFLDKFGDNGPLYYSLLFFGAVLISAAPSYFRNKDYIGYTSLGASGGTSAIMFASLIFAPWSEIWIYFIPVYGIIGGVAYLIYSSWSSRNSRDNIAHDAHFYGAVFGFLFPILLKPSLFFMFIEQLQKLPF